MLYVSIVQYAWLPGADLGGGGEERGQKFPKSA